MSLRSYLFVPGHQERLLSGAFVRQADAVIIDLEDAVPRDSKAVARALTRATLAEHRAWVRINPARSADASADLDAIADRAVGIRIPKVETPEDVVWVTERSGAAIPVICAIESARGVQAAPEIASASGVVRLAIGALDLRHDLRLGDTPDALLYARSRVVIASRAAGLDGPVDSVYPHLGDDAGLQAETIVARSLGFTGKSAIHPRQVPIINAAFGDDGAAITWAEAVERAFEAGGGGPTTLETGEFIDLPVAMRAREILARARDTSS